MDNKFFLIKKKSPKKSRKNLRKNLRNDRKINQEKNHPKIQFKFFWRNFKFSWLNLSWLLPKNMLPLILNFFRNLSARFRLGTSIKISNKFDRKLKPRLDPKILHNFDFLHVKSWVNFWWKSPVKNGVKILGNYREF